MLEVVSDRKLGQLLYTYSAVASGTHVYNAQSNEYIYVGTGGNFNQSGSTTEVNYDCYKPEVMSYSDYYPFGAPLPGRSANSSETRYGFGGKEKDDEISGEGNSYDFGARMYNPRLGRWMSTDRYASKYPSVSPYCAFINSPLIVTDPGGDTIVIVLVNKEEDAVIYAFSQKVVKKQVNDGIFVVVAHGNPEEIGQHQEAGMNDPLTPEEFQDFLMNNKDYKAAKESGMAITVDLVSCNTGTEPNEYYTVGYEYDSEDSFAERFSKLEKDVDVWAPDGYCNFTLSEPDDLWADDLILNYRKKGLNGVRTEDGKNNGGFILFQNGKSYVKFIFPMPNYENENEGGFEIYNKADKNEETKKSDGTKKP